MGEGGKCGGVGGGYIMEDTEELCSKRKAGIVWGKERGGAGLELLS